MKTLSEIQNDYGFYIKNTETEFTLNGIFKEHQIKKQYPAISSSEWKVIPNSEDVYIPFFIKIGENKYVCQQLYNELKKSYDEGNMYFTLDDILGLEVNTETPYRYVSEKYTNKLKAAGVSNFNLHSYDGTKTKDEDVLNQFLFLFGKNKDRVHSKYTIKPLFDSKGNPTADFPANVSLSEAARNKIRSVDEYLIDTTEESTTQTSQTFDINTPQKPSSQTLLQKLWGNAKSLFGG